MTRKDCLRILFSLAGDLPVVLTTGYTCRDAFEINDRDGNFYMVGSMGLAASIAIGVAMESSIRTVAVDGDGSLLMSPGNLFLAGEQQPDILHIMFDNGLYESTGGQKTISHRADFVAIAKACGYHHSVKTANLEEFLNALVHCIPMHGPVFIHAMIEKASHAAVAPRVSIPLPAIHERFKQHIQRLMAGSVQHATDCPEQETALAFP